MVLRGGEEAADEGLPGIAAIEVVHPVVEAGVIRQPCRLVVRESTAPLRPDPPAQPLRPPTPG